MKRFITIVLVLALVISGGMYYTNDAEAGFNYTVKNGDSLYFIGKRYGVSVNSIKAANGLSSNYIYAGQTLYIPTENLQSTSYTVRRGDTLYLIAQKFGVTVTAIRTANNYWKNAIYPGQVFTIPQRSDRPSITTSRSFSRSDLNLLARAVYGESRGEPYKGQVAVAAVILNRVKHPDFPNTIPGVIYQPLAFSVVADGQINLTPDETAYKAVQDAVNGWDPSGGAIYYWNPATAQSKWVWSRTIITQIGNHVFAK